jgi:hypothetical protein
MAKRAAKATAKSKSAARKSASKTAKRKTTGPAARKTNVQVLVAKGALDPVAAARLDRSVTVKINKYKKRDVQFLIRHQLKICGIARPAPDGSFF